jgi:flagellar hook-basal body complex protein FliE
MSISSVGGVNPIGSLGASAPISPLNPVSVPSLGVIGADSSSPTVLDPSSTDAGSGAGSGSSGFASVLAGSIQNLQNLQTRSDELAVKAADGDLQDVHDYTIAATEASLATQLTVAVRDKALAAFSEIMRMQG